jgi:hypothetical protein
MSDTQRFDRSFYTLCVMGWLILEKNILGTPEGCETIRQMYRDSLRVGPALADVPEFQAAMSDISAIQAGESGPDVVAHRFIPPPPSGTTVRA